MRLLALTLVLAVLPAVVPDVALAAGTSSPAPVPVDAGLAVSVAGSVTYKGASAAAASPVSPYMKLRVGDTVEVPADGRLEILYFGSGRREVWPAGSIVKVADGKGEAVKGVATAVDAGESVGRSLENLPIMLRQAQTYQAGQTLVRGGSPPAQPAVALDDVEQAQVVEARGLYTQMRAAAAPDDVFPEMYLASVLLPLGIYDESQAALEKAVAACPKCDEPKVLLEWTKSKTASK